MGVPEGEEGLRRHIRRLLLGWQQWGSEQGLTGTDALMCEGPDERPLAWLCDRADIAGITFACHRIQRRAKAKSCTAVIPYGDSFQVGQIRAFIRWLPPWGKRQSQCLEIADVQWYAAKGTNEALFGALQVSRKFKSDPLGNLCMVEEILPMHVCLVPHLQNISQWQVLFLTLP